MSSVLTDMRFVLAFALSMGCGAKKPAQGERSSMVAIAVDVDPEASNLEPKPTATAPRKGRALKQVCPSLDLSPHDLLLLKLSFDEAEVYYHDALLPFAKKFSPTGGLQAEDEMRKLIRIAEKAENFYVDLASSTSPLWALAAQVRIGQVRSAEARALNKMPALAKSRPKTGGVSKDTARLLSYVRDLEQRSERRWGIALELSSRACIYNEWTRLAQKHLAVLAKRENVVSTRCPEVDVTSSYLVASRLAFDSAEAHFKQTFFDFKVTLVPRTEYEAKELRREVNELANNALGAFLEVAKDKSGPWAIAALVRAGDIKFLHAKVILDIPVSMDLLNLDVPFPENRALGDFESASESAASLLTEQGRGYFDEAIREGRDQCLENHWTAIAKTKIGRPSVLVDD